MANAALKFLNVIRFLGRAYARMVILYSHKQTENINSCIIRANYSVRLYVNFCNSTINVSRVWGLKKYYVCQVSRELTIISDHIVIRTNIRRQL